MLKKNTNSPVDLILMPYFPIEFPPAGPASLIAYLKNEGIDTSFTDFRLINNNIMTFSDTGYKEDYVMDVPDLPLISLLIRNYLKNDHLLKGRDDILLDHTFGRSINITQLRKNITAIYKLSEEYVVRFSKSSIVGFTTYETNFFATVLFTLLLKTINKSVTVIYGGPHISQSENARKIVLKTGVIDAAVIGEGEKTFADIIKSHRKNKTLSVKGTEVYDSSNNKFINNKSNIIDIKTLPCPDYSCYDLKKYPYKNFGLSIYSSRGCKFKCDFCNECIMWGKSRKISPSKTINWMQNLFKKHGSRIYYLADSMVDNDNSWLDCFTDKLIKENSGFYWRCYLRGNIGRKLARKLNKSGLYRTLIGNESFSGRLLKYMHKGSDPDINLSTIENLCDAGIVVEVSMISGYPSETEQDFRKTWKHLFHLKTKYSDKIIVNIEPFQLRPGSKIYNNHEEYGISLKTWNAKFARMLPSASNIIKNTPMTFSFSDNSTGRSIISLKVDTMRKVFFLGDDSTDSYIVKLFKDFYIKDIENINTTDDILSIDDIHIDTIVKDKLYILSQNSQQLPISHNEKLLLERIYNNPGSPENIIAGISLKNEYSIDKFIDFLKKLYENGFNFDISTKK